MTSLQECNACAELCRQFARREPNSRNLWLAEAEMWSRLTHEQMSWQMWHGEPVEIWLEGHLEGPEVAPIVTGV